MATVHDVATYILQKKGQMTTMKLQKLVYYAQAWSLVWEEKALFSNKTEAWANGPIIRALYNFHRGKFNIKTWPQGNPDLLSQSQKETIDAVLGFYGDKTSQWLSDLTHQEKPWKEARNGLMPGASSSSVITQASMAEYYGSL